MNYDAGKWKGVATARGDAEVALVGWSELGLMIMVANARFISILVIVSVRTVILAPVKGLRLCAVAIGSIGGYI